MSGNVVWTRTAQDAVEELRQFLMDKGNADAARRAGKAISDAAKSLAHRPNAGRPVRDEDFPPGSRTWFVPFGAAGYSLLYATDGEVILVLSVKHNFQREYPGYGEMSE